MSYTIELRNEKGEICKLLSQQHLGGGTYQLGGTEDARFNITYNYAGHFYHVMGEKGIRTIYGIKALDSIPFLANAARALRNDVDDDYWKPTEGNARQAILTLINMASQCPDGVWAGD